MRVAKLIFLLNFLYLLIINPLNSFGQDDDYYLEDYLRYENHIYDLDINTVQLNIEGNVLSQPILLLNSNQQLRLSFDDLNESHRNYYYTLIHCTAYWESSELHSTEYIQGVPEDVMYESSYSHNSSQNFIHHWLVFPTQNMKIIRSGNYIIKVFEEGDPNSVVLTWRFMVTENRIEVDGNVFPTRDAKYKSYKQELNFTLKSENYSITNPYQDLKVNILQNNRWDNAHFDVEPTFVKGYEIEYINNSKCVFEGGNEFRNFDLKNMTQAVGVVDKISKDTAGYFHAFLKPDKKRAYKVYSSGIDLNGRRYIKNDLWANNSNVDADYSWVHFTLPYSQRITNGDVYVYGELTNWSCSKNNKMIYNDSLKAYQGKIYVKQGYYNYEYVFLEDGAANPNEILIEGMHSETENDYTILIYHRQLSDNYDRLVAARTLNSVRTLQLTMPFDR